MKPLRLFPSLSLLLLLVACMDADVLTAPNGARLDVLPQNADIYVTNLNDLGAGSLRAAIEAAGNGHVITFDGSLAGGVLNLATELVIGKSLSIVGPPGGVTISGGHSTRIFRIGNVSQVILDRLTLRDGAAPLAAGIPRGGAILNSGNLTIRNSTIEGNWAEERGGAIEQIGASLTIMNSTLASNGTNPAGAITTYGGAIRIENGTLTLVNSTISGNTARNDGGGINNVRGEVNLVHATVANNGANQGGGISNVGFDGSAAYMTIVNSIVAGNVAGLIGNGPDLHNISIGGLSGDSFVDLSAGYSLIGSATGHGLSAAPGNLIGVDPRFEADGLGRPILADNGGPTLTHALREDSPAIGAANLEACLASPVNGLDQRGSARGLGGGCDMGAMESEDASPPADPAVVTLLSIDGSGTVHKVSGVVFVTGTVGCSTPGPVELLVTAEQEQKQRRLSYVVTGSSRVVVNCDGGTQWAAAVQGADGIFVNSEVRVSLAAVGVQAPQPVQETVRLFWSK